MLELSCWLSEHKKPCSDFPIICKACIVFTYIQKEMGFMSKYFQSKYIV